MRSRSLCCGWYKVGPALLCPLFPGRAVEAWANASVHLYVREAAENRGELICCLLLLPAFCLPQSPGPG